MHRRMKTTNIRCYKIIIKSSNLAEKKSWQYLLSNSKKAFTKQISSGYSWNSQQLRLQDM